MPQQTPQGNGRGGLGGRDGGGFGQYGSIMQFSLTLA
jgi:hypothetical protein